MQDLGISIDNNSWHKTLPVISVPFFGESLFGYLLRVENINGLVPGDIIRTVVPITLIDPRKNPFLISIYKHLLKFPASMSYAFRIKYNIV